MVRRWGIADYADTGEHFTVKVWKPALAKAGVIPMRRAGAGRRPARTVPHVLRHTYASVVREHERHRRQALPAGRRVDPAPQPPLVVDVLDCVWPGADKVHGGLVRALWQKLPRSQYRRSFCTSSWASSVRRSTSSRNAGTLAAGARTRSARFSSRSAETRMPFVPAFSWPRRVLAGSAPPPAAGPPEPTRSSPGGGPPGPRTRLPPAPTSGRALQCVRGSPCSDGAGTERYGRGVADVRGHYEGDGV